MMLAGVLALTVITAHADKFGTPGNEFTIDFVPIGNAGNADDAGAGGGTASSPYGGVPYEYRIGTYEISQDAITRATESGMTDVTAGAWAGSQPAANITWLEAAVFVNWLNTSNGHHEAYNLSSGGTVMTLWDSGEAWQLGGENLYRHKDAFYFLPSEDEWYKAAYHQMDGVTANYWDYATGSNRWPIGVTSGTSADTAVYTYGFTSVSSPAAVNLTGGLSPYATRGQNGNVAEWVESAADGINDSPSENRIYRGGGIQASFQTDLLSSFRSSGAPTATSTTLGLRVASIYQAPPVLPVITTLNPANVATEVLADSNLVATFDMPIAIGTGNITIKNLSDAWQDKIPVDGFDVSIAGSVLTIDGSFYLDPGKHYVIQIDPTAIESLEGNRFAGISDDTTWTFATAGAAVDKFGTPGNEFIIDFVPIGNPGNPDDSGAGGGAYSSPHGGVPYEYRMGTYAIPQDAITRATASGLTNVTAGAWPDSLPAANLTWFEAAKFVNWLNTSTGHHAAYQIDAGATTLTPWDSAEAWQLGGENLYRHKDAYYFLPSEDEWYKAGYHQNDDVTANYWDYPTGSNNPPMAVIDGTSSWTAVISDFFNGSPPTVPAAVYSAGGLSSYGTMGQGGNVNEWLESAFDGINDASSEDRAYRGGWYFNSYHYLRASARNSGSPTTSPNNVGIRVASVQLPAIGPAITTLSPAQGATEVPVSSNLVATFDVPIKIGSGYITIKDLSAGSLNYIPVDGPQVSIVDAALTINPATDLEAGKHYAILIDSTAIEDMGGTSFAGISDNTTWDFWTPVTAIAPTITSLSPAKGATTVPFGSNLVATFDVPIKIGRGDITIKDLTTGAPTTIPVDDARVSIAGNVLTIDPEAYFQVGTNYAIRIDESAITNLAGTNFAGISDDTTWSFSTPGAAISGAKIGPGWLITNAVDTDPGNEDRLNVDRTSIALAAGTYDVVRWELNVATPNSGMVTPMLLRGTPPAYTIVWVGNPVYPASAGPQVAFISGSFTLDAPADIYAGFFTTGQGADVIAMDADNSGSGSSLTDQSSVFTAPTAAGQTVDGFSDPAVSRSYAFSISMVQAPLTDFQVTSIRYLGGATPSVELTFNSRAGRTYTVEASTAMLPSWQPGGWIEIDAAVASQGTTTTYIAPLTIVNGPRVFYRVREN